MKKRSKKNVTMMLVVGMILASTLRVNAAEPKLTERNEFWYQITKDGGWVQEQKDEAEPIKVSSGSMALKQDGSATGYAQIEIEERLEKGYFSNITYEERNEKTLLKAVFETFEGGSYEVEIFVDFYDWEAEVAYQKARAEEARLAAARGSRNGSSGNDGNGDSGNGSGGNGSGGNGGSGDSGNGSSGGATPPPFGGTQEPTPSGEDMDGVH